MLTRTLSNFIGGESVPAVAGETMDDIGPATGAVIGRLPASGSADVERAVAAARKAQPSWARQSTDTRARLLEKVADKIESRIDALAELESRDTGKPVWLARTVDIPRAVANFRFFASAVRHDETACHAMLGGLNYTLRRPLGVVGLITPWNLPLYLLSWKTAPALAMGNTIVAKPSELTPLTASALADIFAEVAAPPGVFNLVHGRGSPAGQALVAHPGVKAISFTGGTATGARVAEVAAPRFAKLSLELGGKNSSIVFADADLPAAISGVLRAGFTNQGQVCLCGSRVLVQRSIYERFVDGLVDGARLLLVGDPSDDRSRLGALISAEHRDKVMRYIEFAREDGGKILFGGEVPELPAPFDSGFFLQPTIIAGLNSTCRTACEEIFGPVITVHPFDTDEEALRLANEVRYGLCASVWTTNLSRAHHLAAELEVGMVWVNSWLLRDLRVPFGGSKDSGVGREGGRYSLEFFSEDRNVCIYLGDHP